jgi:signal peptidase II
VHSKNRGVAFNLLEGKTAVVGVITALVVLALLAFFVRHRDRPLLWLPVGLLLGGAAGNVIDRVVHGEVTDFIKLPAWPAFNVADVCITFGVLALFYVLEGRKREA